MSEKPKEYPPINYAAVPPWNRLNRLAVASLALSLLAVGLTPIVCGGDLVIRFLGPVALVILPLISLAAVVTGAIAVHQMKQGRGPRAMGLAITGITVGSVYMLIYGYLFLAFSALFVR